jgi:hypothetical protein
MWKKSGKVLIEKKKRESGSKMRLKAGFGTNSRLGRGRVIHRRGLKWFFLLGVYSGRRE